MAETSNVLPLRALSRSCGGVTAGRSSCCRRWPSPPRSRPLPAGDLEIPLHLSPTLESRLMPLIRRIKGRSPSRSSRWHGSGESFRYHADDVMPTASLIKFPVMIEAYRQAAAKKIDLDSFITLKKQDKVPGPGS